jgi:hypothetical protein
MRGGFWNVWVIIYGALFVFFLFKFRERISALAHPAKVYQLRPGWLWVLPVVLAFQCMGPHLGFKTRGCGEVYSGLMTFGGKTNHLFIPSSIQVFPYLKNMVMITGPSSSGTITHLAETTPVMPKLEFVRRVEGQGNKTVQFEHNGEQYNLEKLNEWPAYEDSGYAWWELKFLAMHAVSREEYERVPAATGDE